LASVGKSGSRSNGVYERTVGCIGDVSGRFMNQTRGTKGLGLVLARDGTNDCHTLTIAKQENVSGRFGKERSGKVCK